MTDLGGVRFGTVSALEKVKRGLKAIDARIIRPE